MKTILKVIVGSTAHGLSTPESDIDYRGVFYVPTSEILKLGNKTQNTSWIEGGVDDTSWEIGHFLDLARHSNPTILETFLSPIVNDETQTEGVALRSLFPYIWSSEGVYSAFRGYSHNQMKKFLEEKDSRPHKYASAYLRVLYQGWELLNTGTFTIRARDTVIGDTLMRWKSKDYTVGEVMQTCRDWEDKLEEAYKNNPDKKTDLDKINDFLVKFRKEHYES